MRFRVRPAWSDATRMDVFAAIAEPHRRTILGLLQRSDLSAGDVLDAMSLSQPGVSRHLKMLYQAGLVSVRSDGRRRIYRIEPTKLAEIDAWLEPYKPSWGSQLGAPQDHLGKES
jgi:DNA-binding transcriptional ArsR family regulator